MKRAVRGNPLTIKERRRNRAISRVRRVQLSTLKRQGFW